MEPKEVTYCKHIHGYRDLYTIDIFGNVFSFKSNRHLTHSVSKFGYAFVTLYKDLKIKKISIHRLVAMHFLPNPENKKTVNHKDGNKLNNRLSNLEWATALENNVHAYETGLKVLPKGKDDKRSKPIQQLSLDGKLIREWAGAREAQRLGGFRQSNIWHCLAGNQNQSQGFIWKYKTL